MQATFARLKCVGLELGVAGIFDQNPRKYFFSLCFFKLGGKIDTV